MRVLEKLFDKYRPQFERGGKYHKLYPLFEMMDTILLWTNARTESGPHVRDALDLKRFMMMVVVALLPATIFGIYNIGYQHYQAVGASVGSGEMFEFGLIKFLPIVIVSYLVGGFWEVLFAVVRKHEVNEGFLVTGLLFPLVLPPTIPLWQVAVAISFGVVIGKEVFGGTGMNILNPALTARAFVFFAYPGKISGDKVWTAIDSAKDKLVDTFTGATPLLVASNTEAGSTAVQTLNHATQQFANVHYGFWDMFYGLIPGSIGETSTLAILVGGLLLIITGVASWRIIVAVFAGGYGMAWLMNILAGPGSGGMFTLPPHYHLVMGGFALGAVFMATDPVSASQTRAGKWIYGILIGVLAILVRTVNPAYPEGMMLAILFMNIFAPFIDYYVIKAHLKRRLKRA
ncbi:MAG TPA: NADH:ubiquinone reductase (Na(+)-transporting) subunit B [Caldithrix abyssi]|uniref:Na(+)-translocating NADH-quinone reductase subunit B n=1 Tax=Caldithrix abyssi TaxID=187145 RepID=A0A7V4UC61_CALAY|nr:NADH:ubiquinone reductase (Na(+)-transporting) subunit B [Caldithrix abyssi]